MTSLFMEKTEHNERLRKVMEHLETAGLKLNKEKCGAAKTTPPHKIDAGGTQPDPAKVSTINKLMPPRNVNELRRVLGMVNYLGKCIPNLDLVGQTMYEL